MPKPDMLQFFMVMLGDDSRYMPYVPDELSLFMPWPWQSNVTPMSPMAWMHTSKLEVRFAMR